MKVESYDFEVHGGAVPHEEREGKTHWPDQLTLEMDAFHAFDLVTEILNQLRDGKKVVLVTRCGALDHTETADV